MRVRESGEVEKGVGRRGFVGGCVVVAILGGCFGDWSLLSQEVSLEFLELVWVELSVIDLSTPLQALFTPRMPSHIYIHDVLGEIRRSEAMVMLVPIV